MSYGSDSDTDFDGLLSLLTSGTDIPETDAQTYSASTAWVPASQAVALDIANALPQHESSILHTVQPNSKPDQLSLPHQGITTSQLLSQCINSRQGQSQEQLHADHTSQSGIASPKKPTDLQPQIAVYTETQVADTASLPDQLYDLLLALFGNVQSLAGKVSGILLDSFGYSDEAVEDGWDKAGLQRMLENSDTLHARIHQALTIMLDNKYIVSAQAWGKQLKTLEQSVTSSHSTSAPCSATKDRSSSGSGSSITTLTDEQHSMLGSLLYWSVLPCVQDMIRLASSINSTGATSPHQPSTSSTSHSNPTSSSSSNSSSSSSGMAARHALAARVAGRVTGMLLELPASDSWHLANEPGALRRRVGDALQALHDGGVLAEYGAVLHASSMPQAAQQQRSTLASAMRVPQGADSKASGSADAMQCVAHSGITGATTSDTLAATSSVSAADTPAASSTSATAQDIGMSSMCAASDAVPRQMQCSGSVTSTSYATSNTTASTAAAGAGLGLGSRAPHCKVMTPSHSATSALATSSNSTASVHVAHHSNAPMQMSHGVGMRPMGMGMGTMPAASYPMQMAAQHPMMPMQMGMASPAAFYPSGMHLVAPAVQAFAATASYPPMVPIPTQMQTPMQLPMQMAYLQSAAQLTPVAMNPMPSAGMMPGQAVVHPFAGSSPEQSQPFVLPQYSEMQLHAASGGWSHPLLEGPHFHVHRAHMDGYPCAIATLRRHTPLASAAADKLISSVLSRIAPARHPYILPLQGVCLPNNLVFAYPVHYTLWDVLSGAAANVPCPDFQQAVHLVSRVSGAVVYLLKARVSFVPLSVEDVMLPLQHGQEEEAGSGAGFVDASGAWDAYVWLEPGPVNSSNQPQPSHRPQEHALALAGIMALVLTLNDHTDVAIMTITRSLLSINEDLKNPSSCSAQAWHDALPGCYGWSAPDAKAYVQTIFGLRTATTTQHVASVMAKLVEAAQGSRGRSKVAPTAAGGAESRSIFGGSGLLHGDVSTAASADAGVARGRSSRALAGHSASGASRTSAAVVETAGPAAAAGTVGSTGALPLQALAQGLSQAYFQARLSGGSSSSTRASADGSAAAPAFPSSSTNDGVVGLCGANSVQEAAIKQASGPGQGIQTPGKDTTAAAAAAGGGSLASAGMGPRSGGDASGGGGGGGGGDGGARRVSADGGEAPPSFVCPISHCLMQEPVLTCDGYSYERSAIAAWIARAAQVGKEAVSPMTNLKLESLTLIPNRALREAIEAWQAGKGSRNIGALRI